TSPSRITVDARFNRPHERTAPARLTVTSAWIPSPDSWGATASTSRAGGPGQRMRTSSPRAARPGASLASAPPEERRARHRRRGVVAAAALYGGGARLEPVAHVAALGQAGELEPADGHPGRAH